MNLNFLGLTTYEEKAYFSLIKLGVSSASTISQDSGVPYGKIYPTLDSLENKGLISIIPQKTKKFQANDPNALLEMIKKRKIEMDSIESQLKELKQVYLSNPKEAVSVIKGKNNFYKVDNEMPKPKKNEYNIKYNSEIRPEWIREAREHKKKGIDFKVLARIDSQTKNNLTEWLKYTKNIKKIPNNGVAVSIIDDSAMFINMINSNVTVLIKDKATIELFTELFNNYYSRASIVQE